MNASLNLSGANAMIGQSTPASLRSTARIAGVLYLVIIAAGMFAQFMVRSSLIVPGDAAATASNILAAEGLFRMGIMGDLIMILSDVAIGLAFYVLLRPVNPALSLLAAFFRLAQATVLGINLLNLLVATQFLSGADYLTVLGAEQRSAQALLFLNAHSTGYALGLAFFAFSILILGYLMFRSGYFPRILGILLVVAAIAYLADTSARILLPNYADYQELFDSMVVMPAFIAEFVLCLWLLVKGVRSPARSHHRSVMNPTPAEGLAS